MRAFNFADNEHYHLCGRGVMETEIFLDDADYVRFLFLILHLQSPTQVNNMSEAVKTFLKKGYFKITEEKLRSIADERSVELIAFSLMPNHFHLLVRNLELQAISIYMHRVLMAYSKYFNAKYVKTGHVFQGPFRAVHTESNSQLLNTSAYIHKNPKEIRSSKTPYDEYPWSSFQDYTNKNRWGELLKRNIVLDQFKSQEAYKQFVHTSKTKGEEPLLT